MVDHSDENLKQAVAELRDDNNPINWVLSGYAEGSQNKIVLVGKGEGGFEEFKQKLEDDKVLYGVFKVVAVDDENSRRSKFVFVTWVGEKVKPLQRARVSTHQPKMGTFFTHHVSFQVNNLENLSKEDIELKLSQSSGAHKPKEYIF